MTGLRDSKLENLGPELKNIIAGFCDAKSVMNLALSGIVFYDHIKRQERPIIKGILASQIGEDVLRLAAARLETSGWNRIHSPRSDEEDRKCVTRVMDCHLSRTSPSRANTFGMNLGDVAKLQSFHSVTLYYADVLSSIALYDAPGPLTEWHAHLPHPINCVSPTEFRRFVKALYIFELVGNLFKKEYMHDEDPNMYVANQEFWGHFAPWEQQQVRCVQTILLRHLSYGEWQQH